jgi:hypothetical protein
MVLQPREEEQVAVPMETVVPVVEAVLMVERQIHSELRPSLEQLKSPFQGRTFLLDPIQMELH